MKLDLRFSLVLACFFLSGFAALLYETAWAREFAFVFGTSELAVVSVLAAYMAGLAAGAAVAARFVARVRRPVLVYGVLELGIAASALAVPWGIRFATKIQTLAVGGLPAPPDEASVGGALFYVACSFVILMIPTGLMGATLPLLARHAVRSSEEIGRRVGALYAANTAGAVVGTLVAGFVLLPALGLRQTVYAGVATNALVFGAAALLARRAPPVSEAPAGAADRPRRFHWVLPFVALSGIASFTYEVVWTRLLGHMLGGSIQGFSTMLGSFLLGIAIGSAVAARRARDPATARRGLVAAQIGTAALSLAAFAAVDRLPELAGAIGAGRTGSLGANAVIAMLGLLPGALCIGAVYPFAVRLLARDEANAAPAAARVYAWNTLGSITGALAAGLLLLPALRFADTMLAAASLNLLLALAAATLVRPPAKALAGAAALGLAFLFFVPPAPPWGVLRHRAASDSGWQGEVAHYGVGRSSTVMLFEQPRTWRLTSNGQPESAIDRAESTPDPDLTPRWLSLIPVLLRPDTRSMLIIGLGGGHTVDAVPPTVAEVSVIELEREIVEAHRVLEKKRGHSPLSSPRVRLVVNDARGSLTLTDARFDAVVSQPSHPWTMGASHLYTREFFSLASEHLNPGGVFVQWIGLAFVDETLLRNLLATLLDVFPHVALFQPVTGAVLFAASDEPLDPLSASAEALARSPAGFARYGLRVPEDVAAHWLLDTAGARAFSEGGAFNTDDHNQLATRSARLGPSAIQGRELAELLARHDPLRRGGALADPIYTIRRLVAQNDAARAERLAEAVPDSTLRSTALGWAASGRSLQRASMNFRRALANDPANQAALFGLLRVNRRAIEAGSPVFDRQVADLDGVSAAVVQGWRHVSEGKWSELRTLETELAAADLRHIAHGDASRLRIQWRLASKDPAHHAEAAEIADDLLGANPRVDDILLGTRALAAVGRSEETFLWLEYLSRSRLGPPARRSALGVLDALPPGIAGDERAVVRERLTTAVSGTQSAESP